MNDLKNALLLVVWLLALYGIYLTDEWIDNLPKMERRQ
jgi:hypothetical protein